MSDESEDEHGNNGDSSDSEGGGLFGNMMKGMFQESAEDQNKVF